MASADIANQIVAYDKNKVTSEGALNDALKEYGIPEIRQNVAGLRTTVANTTAALNNVDPSVTGRTQGSLVTEAQRQRQVVNERAPIAGQLTTFGGQLGDQERTLAENTGLATTKATNRVNDYTTGRLALQSQYDNEYKREQDTASREAERQAFAESQRQFNEGQLTTRNAARYSGSGGSKASAGEQKQAAQQAITAGLAKNSGKDGFVSRASFGAALNDFQAAGLGDVRKFWQAFGRYVNPKTKSQYPGFNQR